MQDLLETGELHSWIRADMSSEEKLHSEGGYNLHSQIQKNRYKW